MPPFSKMDRPPTTTKLVGGLIVKVNKCFWCKIRIAYRCRQCGQWTCNYCLVSKEGGLCVHVANIPLPNDGWGIDCPNPMCDNECNTCMGRGVVFGSNYE